MFVITEEFFNHLSSLAATPMIIPLLLALRTVYFYVSFFYIFMQMAIARKTIRDRDRKDDI